MAITSPKVGRAEALISACSSRKRNGDEKTGTLVNRGSGGWLTLTSGGLTSTGTGDAKTDTLGVGLTVSNTTMLGIGVNGGLAGAKAGVSRIGAGSAGRVSKMMMR